MPNLSLVVPKSLLERIRSEANVMPYVAIVDGGYLCLVNDVSARTCFSYNSSLFSRYSG